MTINLREGVFKVKCSPENVMLLCSKELLAWMIRFLVLWNTAMYFVFFSLMCTFSVFSKWAQISEITAAAVWLFSFFRSHHYYPRPVHWESSSICFARFPSHLLSLRLSRTRCLAPALTLPSPLALWRKCSPMRGMKISPTEAPCSAVTMAVGRWRPLLGFSQLLQLHAVSTVICCSAGTCG